MSGLEQRADGNLLSALALMIGDMLGAAIPMTVVIISMLMITSLHLALATMTGSDDLGLPDFETA